MLDPHELDLFNQRCPEVFTKVYKEYYKNILIHCNNLLNDEVSAYDIAQDTFSKLWERQLPFESEQLIKAFLYTAARNVCIDKHRKSKPHRRLLKWLQQLQHFEDPQVISDHEATTAIIENARQQLPSHLEEIIHLAYDCHKKNKEIADKLNVSIDTVKSRRRQALAQLKKLLPNIFMTLWLWTW